MFITITRTGLHRIGVGLGVFAVLTTVFILFPRENAEPTAAEQAVPASVSDWGLSFQTEGQPPVGNVSAEELRQYNAFYVGDTSQKTIYLTFDAGYENGCTPAILDALKKHNAPACFFVVGNFIDTAPELVKRMAAEGHIVGNHTLHHPDMSGIADKSAFAAELNGLEEKYTALTGQPMQKFYRPPQGKFSEENLRQAQELGYTTVFWSLAYVDWYTDNQPTDEQAFSKLLPRRASLRTTTESLPLPAHRISRSMPQIVLPRWLRCRRASTFWCWRLRLHWPRRTLCSIWRRRT